LLHNGAPEPLYFNVPAATGRRLRSNTDKGHPARKNRSAKPLTYTPERGRTDAAVAEVMPKRDEICEGRRHAHVASRPGLSIFAAREKHCKLAAQTRERGRRTASLRSNWAAPSDILNWHVAAILIPYRSRGAAD
jgi:hypothetical protein